MIVDDTVARRSATFAATIVSVLSVDGTDLRVRTEKSGSFDDDAFEGVGKLGFDTDHAAFDEALGLPEEDFEFRLVDRTLWFYNPVPAETGWRGSHVLEFAKDVGGDPTPNMDGDAWISLVVASATGVEDVTVENGTCMTSWSLVVDADELAPLVTTGGSMRRLFPDGAQTGEGGRATVVVDEDGMVSTMRVDLDAWAAAAMEGTGEGTQGRLSGMTLSFRIGDFDQPVRVSAPCSDPVPHEEPGQPESLLCRGE